MHMPYSIGLYHVSVDPCTNKKVSSLVIGENAKTIHEATLQVKRFEMAMMELNAKAAGFTYVIDVTDETGAQVWV
jgi:iron only hydrogenase large subunit-like protein